MLPALEYNRYTDMVVIEGKEALGLWSWRVYYFILWLCCSFCIAIICLRFSRLLRLCLESQFLGTLATDHLAGCPATPTEDSVSPGHLGIHTPWCFCMWSELCSPPLSLRAWEFKFSCHPICSLFYRSCYYRSFLCVATVQISLYLERF